MARRAIFLAAAAIIAVPLASTTAAAQSAAKPSKAEIADAGRDLNVIAAALTSDKVPVPVKNALFQCLYQNTLGKISGTASKVLAANKLDRSSADKALAVLAGVCGYRPKGK